MGSNAHRSLHLVTDIGGLEWVERDGELQDGVQCLPGSQEVHGQVLAEHGRLPHKEMGGE
jgi:hypothetical protein